MAFLTPLFLVGLLAAAIPVAIHLIRKEKPPKMVFSTLRFIKNTSRKLVLFQQIQQWLLLLLRSAVIALIVMAFARPLFDSNIANLVDAEPESAVVLIDSSMSMRYGERFAQAREAAQQVVADLSAGDEVAVIAFDNAGSSVRELSADLDGARSFIASLEQPGFATTRYMPALRLANDMLESSSNQKRRIYLISDYQATGMGNDDSGWMLSPGVLLNTIDVGEGATRNLLLTDVRSPDQLIENRDEYEILARTRSSGSVHLDQADVRLVLDGQESNRVPVDLSEASEAVVRLPAVFDSAGTHRGEIRVGGDEFATDNSYFFTVDVMAKIRVLVVNGEPSPNWYEDEAHWFDLAVDGAQSPFILSTATEQELTATLLAQQDVVVLLNAGSALSPSQSRALNEYVNEGGSLLLAPGDRVNAAQFNQMLGALSPVELRDSIRFAGGDYLLIADMDRRHPILLPLGAEWGVRFEGYWAAQPVADATVLMQFDNGSPALTERAVGSGNVLLFASSLDTEWNNLPLQGLFLPFVHESLRYLARAGSKERAYRVGSTIDLSAVLGEETILRVTGPDGRALTLASGGRGLIPDMPGFYSVETDAGVQYFAVNADPEESSLEKMAPSTLQDSVSNPDTQPEQSVQVRTEQLMVEREGPQRMWWWILLLVVLMLLAETRIANTTYR
ncbi:MAG: BatA domain-containing protein [Gammaproteobacteria bacterium]|nr:BatA domain-containing protein [Pseudomonadales bacterium]